MRKFCSKYCTFIEDIPSFIILFLRNISRLNGQTGDLREQTRIYAKCGVLLLSENGNEYYLEGDKKFPLVPVEQGD